jgi:Yip1 domain
MDLVPRAKKMLISPNSEWQVVAAEPADTASLYSGYIVPLSAIPPICMLIGFTLFLGHAGFGFGLLAAVLTYVLGLIGVYILALIAQKLAPSFGGRADFVQALKLVAYALTAAWVGGLFLLVPFLGGILRLLMVIYGLYLLYRGTVPVMGVPADRAVTYTGAIILVAILIFFLISLVISLLGFSLLTVGG